MASKVHPLKIWLVSQNRTVRSLAAELDVHPTQIAQWMSGYRLIPAGVAVRIEALTKAKVRASSWIHKAK